MYYFDHCATTPPYPEVIDTVTESMKRYYGNPSSLHRIGSEAQRLLRRSREVVAESLHVPPSSIVFTSGGTESNNLAIKGALRRYAGRGNHIITTAVEHASVYDLCGKLEQSGYRVTYIQPDATGAVKVEDVRAAITDETMLVSVMYVNNEVGRIQPIAELGAMLAKYPTILFHVDAVQAIGKVALDPIAMGIDMFSASAHKFRGPKGIGFLYLRQGLLLDPELVGGGQEAGLRSGTENVPLIAGMAKAVRLTMERLAANRAYLGGLRARLVERLTSIPGVVLNGSTDPADMAPHVVNVSVPGMRAEVLLHAMEERGYCISTKSACSSGEEKPSRVLLAMGHDRLRALSGLRISLAPDHTEAEIDGLAQALAEVVRQYESTVR